MSREAGRLKQPATNETGWMLLGAVLVVVLLLGVILWLGALVNPAIKKQTSQNPVSVLAALFTGTVAPSAGEIALTLGLFVVVAAVIAVIVMAAVKQRKGSSRIDYKARFMASRRDLAEFFAPAAEKDSTRLGASKAGIGVPLATAVGLPNGRMYASWEWVQIWLMGPRAGKTSCVCIPQILETAGPVLATSNKRDIVDLTRGPRSERGVVWVHDVQDIIGEPATWWWNPLTFVTDIETAEKLADIFISSATAAGSKQDAYFESAGKETLSRLFLAAALDRRPVTDVFAWANDPGNNDTVNPAEILLKHGEDALGRALDQTQNLTEKQRDGVYGTIRPWIGVLGNRKVLPWITETGARRPHFDPEAFVRSTDTIYLISREGGGTARAITGALTMAILMAAESVGARQRGGRLTTPLMAVLDEAANVCRWRELPDVYSHYGSRGIILSAFFQSWAQGVEAFGETGMAKLWSAANIRVAGSGLAEDKFLPFVASLVGDHDVLKRSSSSQTRGRSVTTSVQRERIFDISDIEALPRGRALMLAAGTPATLIKLDHFSTRPYAEKVASSREFYEARAATEGHLPPKGEGALL
jgi:type IV secretory pathway TraG/TraD family ATPase VirD4